MFLRCLPALKAAAVAAAAAFSIGAGSAAAQSMHFGIPAYWGTQGEYAKIPSGSLAVINPHSGILDESKQTLEIAANAGEFGAIIADMQKRGVEVYGYVPTGYFNHECNTYGKCQTWKRIFGQIYAYFQLYPQLDGIFFDEASGENKTCDDFTLEYARLRGLVKRYKEDANIVFNPGWSNACVVEASQPGEVVLTFENAGNFYTKDMQTTQKVADLAKQRGVKTWHLVHSVKGKEALKKIVKQAKRYGVDYFYATNIGGNWQAGDNTWGSPAAYWSSQVKLLRK